MFLQIIDGPSYFHDSLSIGRERMTQWLLFWCACGFIVASKTEEEPRLFPVPAEKRFGPH